jgi:hypothetical protein
MFNASLQHETETSAWKKANVSPFFKKSDRSNPTNSHLPSPFHQYAAIS